MQTQTGCIVWCTRQFSFLKYFGQKKRLSVSRSFCITCLSALTAVANVYKGNPNATLLSSDNETNEFTNEESALNDFDFLKPDRHQKLLKLRVLSETRQVDGVNEESLLL